MKIQQTTLDSGVVVITERVAGLGSASIGIWVENGSRHEDGQVNGISHFYEHMVFKGTKNRDPIDIVRSIESKGGYINAYTTRDHTCFYTRVVKEELGLATEVLCDMVNEPLLLKEDFHKEKEVILEEVRAALDNPEDIIHDIFAEALWGKEGLGLPIAGYLSTVNKIKLTDLKKYQTSVRNKFHLVVSASGAVRHQEFVNDVKKALTRQKSFKYHKTQFQKSKSRHLVRQKEVQQCNLVVGNSFPTHGIRQQVALNLMNNVFGDGMSSRLFQTIREEHGLAYTVYSCVDNYKDTMSFNIGLSLEDRKFEAALKLLSQEIQLLKREGINQAELDQAKATLKGGLQLSLESTSSRMNYMARQVMRRPNESPYTPAKTLKLIDQIKLSEVNDLIDEVFDMKTWASALIQPKGPKLSVSKWLKF